MKEGGFMWRRKPLAFVIVLLLVVGLVWAGGDGRAGRAAKAVEKRAHNLRAALEVTSIVHASFVTPVRRASLLSSYLRTGSVDGMLETLDDPYTRYMGPRAWESLREETKGTFQGIGVIIGIKEKHIIVISPIEGTPGFRSGLEPGDRILEIDGRSTRKMTTQQAADLMRGTKGTKVRLDIERGVAPKPEQFAVAIVRDDIKLRSVSAEAMSEAPDIGYVRIVSFAETTSAELDRELLRLKKAHVKGLILDLRYNPGGLLTQAIEVCGEFLKRGTPVLHVLGRGEAKATYSTSTSDGYWGKLPMVILTNEGTASASEIVTGALQDYGVATVVGTKTFGKGLIQTVIPLNSGGGVTVTTAQYLTAKRRAINKIGIAPDVLVKLPVPPKRAAKGLKASAREDQALKDTQLEAATGIVRDKIARKVAKRAA